MAAAAPTLGWLIVGRSLQGAGAVSAAVTALLADTTYYVTVWKYPDAAGEDGLNDVQLRVDGSVIPPNDLCENAAPITFGWPAFGTTIGATDN